MTAASEKPLKDLNRALVYHQGLPVAVCPVAALEAESLQLVYVSLRFERNAHLRLQFFWARIPRKGLRGWAPWKGSMTAECGFAWSPVRPRRMVNQTAEPCERAGVAWLNGGGWSEPNPQPGSDHVGFQNPDDLIGRMHGTIAGQERRVTRRIGLLRQLIGAPATASA